MKIKFMQLGQEYQVEQVGTFSPEADAGRGAGRRRGRVRLRRHQDRQRREDRRHDHRGRPSRARAVPGLQGNEADGVRRAVSRRRQRVPAAARRAREAAAERRLVPLRAGDLARARLRVPLRLPRPAPHGDRPGAAGARVRRRPDHDRAGRSLPRDDDRRRGAGDRQPGEAARRRADREDRGAGHHGDDPDAVDARRRDSRAVPGEARHPERAGVPRRPTACWSPTSCRSTRSCSTSTIG